MNDLQHVSDPALDVVVTGVGTQFSEADQLQIVERLLVQAYPDPGAREEYVSGLMGRTYAQESRP